MGECRLMRDLASSMPPVIQIGRYVSFAILCCVLCLCPGGASQYVSNVIDATSHDGMSLSAPTWKTMGRDLLRAQMDGYALRRQTGGGVGSGSGSGSGNSSSSASDDSSVSFDSDPEYCGLCDDSSTPSDSDPEYCGLCGDTASTTDDSSTPSDSDPEYCGLCDDTASTTDDSSTPSDSDPKYCGLCDYTASTTDDSSTPWDSDPEYCGLCDDPVIISTCGELRQFFKTNTCCGAPSQLLLGNSTMTCLNLKDIYKGNQCFHSGADDVLTSAIIV